MSGRILRQVSSLVVLIVACGSAIFWSGQLAAQTFPINGTGYNYNMVVGVGQTFAGSGVNATQDAGTLLTGNAWYAMGQNTTSTVTGVQLFGYSGLPMGATFGVGDAATGGDLFQLQNTGAANVLMLAASSSEGPQSATFTLNNPATYSNLSFVLADGNGTANIGVTLNYSDFSTASGTITSNDWFPGGTYNTAWIANGRLGSGGYANVSGGNPRLTAVDLTGLSTSASLSSITFNVLGAAGNNTTISFFGISGNGGYIKWTGTASSNWNTSDSNWTPGSFYSDGSNVLFDNTGTNTAISVGGAGVQPANVTFSNGAVPYSFSGAAISGSGSVMLGNAAGSVTFNNANTYTGFTTISAGTLVLGNQNAAQNSTILLGANNGLAFANGTTATTIGGLSNAGSSGGSFALKDAGSNPVALTLGGNNMSTSYSGVISGAGGSLTKTGSGTIFLTGASTYTGGNSINGGVVVSTLTAGNGASSGIGAGVPTGSSLEFNGGTLFERLRQRRQRQHWLR